jgi:hypothetical protein
VSLTLNVPPPSIRIAPALAAPLAIETLAPSGRLIWTASFAPGTCPDDQFAGLFHFPPRGLIQVSDANGTTVKFVTSGDAARGLPGRSVTWAASMSS